MVHSVRQRIQIPLDPPSFRLALPGEVEQTESYETPAAGMPPTLLSSLACHLLYDLREASHPSPDIVTASDLLAVEVALAHCRGHSTRRLVRAAFAELVQRGYVVAVQGEVA
jgi:hypothetical protein